MRKFYLFAFLGLVLSGGMIAFGDTPAPAGDTNVTGKEVAQDTSSLNLFSIDGGADFTTGYYFRGYREQNSGLMIQPYANLSINIGQLQNVNNSGFTFTPYIGTWNSINTVQSGTRTPKSWYETDAIAGLNIEKGPFTLGFVYTYYYSPSGAFTSTQEGGVTLKFDDSAYLKPVSLNPHVGLYREFNRSANLANGGPGTYFEAGIEPSVDEQFGKVKVTLSLPTTVGLSFDRYYLNSTGGNEALGYGSVGGKASIPLNDKLSVNASVTYLHLYANSAVAANGGEANQVIGSVGFTFSF